MPSIRFGASPSTPTLRPPAEHFRLVQRIEEWGFESVWAGDHVSFHNPICQPLAPRPTKFTGKPTGKTFQGTVRRAGRSKRSSGEAARPKAAREAYFLWGECGGHFWAPADERSSARRDRAR